MAQDRPFMAKPLGIATLVAVAVVLATTMEWGEAEDTTPANVHTNVMGAGPVPGGTTHDGVDPFYEQKKAAKVEELPAQF